MSDTSSFAPGWGLAGDRDGLWLRVDNGAGDVSLVFVDAATVIGRDLRCDVVVADDEVSRQHARLEPGPSGWTVTDLGTTNGTLVNRARLVGPAVLRTNDVIRVGRAACTVVPPPTG